MSTHLNTRQCCNHTFTSSDIIPPLMNQQTALATKDPHLYGGNVQRFANAKCPECGKEYLLWLKPISGGYKVLTISEKVEVPTEPQTTSRRGARSR